MKIILSNVIEIQRANKDIIDWAKKELTFKNPQYAKLKAMGYSIYKVPKDIKLYNMWEDRLYVPYGCFEDIWRLHPHIEDYVDYTTTKNIEVESDIQLRDYQTHCVRAVEEFNNTILSLPCGCGKTLSCLQSVAKVKQRTLWLAHTIDLVNQAKSSCEKFMKCKTSYITDGKMDLSGDIVFATVQSVLKFIENKELRQDEFGMIVLDECQHLSANPKSLQMFRLVFEYFSARYKVGLSATIHRSDGLQDCIIKIIGNVKYNIVQRGDNYVCMYDEHSILRFPVNKFQIPCYIKLKETTYNVWDKEVFSENGGTIQFASLISNIAMDEKRNNQIIKDLKKMKGSTIILSDRVEQLKYLCEFVEDGVQIDGSTPKKQRTKALEDIRTGKKKYLFASYQLAKEGLDCPILSNLVMATPVKDFAIVVQSIGRIQRPFGDKKIAYVYDYLDDVGMLLKFYTKRRTIYRKNNWKIEGN